MKSEGKIDTIIDYINSSRLEDNNKHHSPLTYTNTPMSTKQSDTYNSRWKFGLREIYSDKP
jgi:hypothetical protein